LVGAVPDPTERFAFKIAVGRATVPVHRRSISGCELGRDYTLWSGLKQTLIAAMGLHMERI